MLELEIQSLLILHENPLAASKALCDKYLFAPLTFSQVESIVTFLKISGAELLLCDFLIARIENDKKLPWAQIADQLLTGVGENFQEISLALQSGANEQNMTWHLAKSLLIDRTQGFLVAARKEHRQEQVDRLLSKKRELLSQIETLRSQEIEEEEGKMLEGALKMFPRDVLIQQQYEAYKQRIAMKLLDERIQNPPEKDWSLVATEAPDPEAIEILQNIKKSMQDFLVQNPEWPLERDFAVAHLMWDNPSGALEFLKTPNETSLKWLKAEAELASHCYVDLLDSLLSLERVCSKDPDALIYVQFLRAQGLWGMGRRFDAIELMESISSTRPGFHSSSSLLAVWKGQVV